MSSLKQKILNSTTETRNTCILKFSKPDCSCRPISKLKNLNKSMSHFHSEMETLTLVLSFRAPGCYMASMGLEET